MALVITQETFDEAVKENIEEFEMTEEEAVEEAKKQFKAQGVNLSNIIMTCSSALVVSRCIKSIEKLLSQSHPERDEEISQELKILKVELDKELGIRVRAGNEGLYSLLIQCLRKMDAKYLLQVLEALTSLTNGYPDLLDKPGIDFMLVFLQSNIDVELIIQNLKWVKNCVTAHEKNRSDLIQGRIQDSFRKLLLALPDDPRLLMYTCQVIRKLVSDDDIRVIHGNPHEHARVLANELLCCLINFLECWIDDMSVLTELIPTVAALAVRDEFCIKIYERGGVQLILNAMSSFFDDEKINRHCMCLLKALAGSDYVKEPIIQRGAGPLIVSAMSRHKSSPALVTAGCVCISALALRSPSNAQALVEAGSPDILITVMNMYKDNSSILKSGCWAIRNILSRSHELRSKFISLGVEMLINSARFRFPRELDYEARVTLRDLGCEIDEDWQQRRKSHRKSLR